VDVRVRWSIDYDTAMKASAPQDSRWDYFLVPDASSGAVAIEVHPAKASEVDRVIQKRRDSEAVLVKRCPKLGRVNSWHWLLPKSGTMALTRSSPQARRLAKAGILFPKRRLAEKDLR
jgi:hypothetical protein